MAEYIDREAVCKRLVEAADVQRKAKSKEFAAGIMGAQGIVWLFPATENVVDVVHGEWKPTARYSLGFSECSVCGYETLIKSNYCPNCGAQMDGEDGDA